MRSRDLRYAGFTMRLASALFTTVLATSLVSCDSEESEETMPPPELRVMADVTEVAQGGTITLTIEVEHFSLTGEGDHDHDDHDDHDHLQLDDDLDLVSPDEPFAAEDGHDHDDHGHEDHDHDGEAYEGPREGHVHVYLDDVMTNPLAMLTTATGEVVIDAEPGTHTLINRLHGADHKIIEPQIIEEIEITVTAP